MIELDTITRNDLKSLPDKKVKRNFKLFRQIFFSNLGFILKFESEWSEILFFVDDDLNFTQFTEPTMLIFKLRSGNFVGYLIQAKS